MLMVDSLGMASRDFLFNAHLPCQKGRGNDVYECKMYLTVEDPNMVTKLNVGFGDHEGTQNEETKSGSIDFDHFCQSSLYEVLDSDIRLLDNFTQSLTNGDSLTDISKAFQISLKIRVSQETLKTGFFLVAVFGILIGVAQFAVSPNQDIILRFFLAIGSLFTFMAIAVAAQSMRNHFKLKITLISICQLLTMAIFIVYNVYLVALRKMFKLESEKTLPALLQLPRVKHLFDGKSLTDIFDWLFTAVIFLGFIITLFY